MPGERRRDREGSGRSWRFRRLAKSSCGGRRREDEAQAPENKLLRLRDQTRRATELEILGAPSFVVGGELFWGNDRLEDALAWAAPRTGETRR